MVGTLALWAPVIKREIRRRKESNSILLYGRDRTHHFVKGWLEQVQDSVTYTPPTSPQNACQLYTSLIFLQTKKICLLQKNQNLSSERMIQHRFFFPGIEVLSASKFTNLGSELTRESQEGVVQNLTRVALQQASSLHSWRTDAISHPASLAKATLAETIASDICYSQAIAKGILYKSRAGQ